MPTKPQNTTAASHSIRYNSTKTRKTIMGYYNISPTSPMIKTLIYSKPMLIYNWKSMKRSSKAVTSAWNWPNKANSITTKGKHMESWENTSRKLILSSKR